MTEDLVTELRAWGTNGYMMQAADEIERLNACVAEANAYMAEAALAIERLRKERDEARREVCGFHHLTGFLAGDYANSRGWNYLNDERNWPEFPQSVTDFKLFLEGQDKIFLEINDLLRKELAETERLLDEYQREAADRTRWENT